MTSMQIPTKDYQVPPQVAVYCLGGITMVLLLELGLFMGNTTVWELTRANQVSPQNSEERIIKKAPRPIGLGAVNCANTGVILGKMQLITTSMVEPG